MSKLDLKSSFGIFFNVIGLVLIICPIVDVRLESASILNISYILGVIFYCSGLLVLTFNKKEI